jgi:hypothetical protein
MYLHAACTLRLVGFAIFSYVVDTHMLFSSSVFVLGIVVTEWASIASYARSLASESDAELCAAEDLTQAQEAALRAMADAFNGSCSFTVRVGVEGLLKGQASACGQ